MAATAKHEKMLILGFKDSKDVEKKNKSQADLWLEALINPDSYTQEYKLKYSDNGQAQGSSGQELKYEMTLPQEMSFEFLFDNTGIIDGKPRESIVDDLKKFKALLVEFNGESHQPYILKLAWGNNEVFKCRALEVSINYKLFSADGSPIRALAKVKFRSTVDDEKRASAEKKQSPDLTHIRVVKPGDNLPMMCAQIYGDPTYYLLVAAFNNIENFRVLEPGSKIIFPSVEKTQDGSRKQQ